MKRLILLRHAKSSWVNPELDDIDRPLNKRGKRSAKALGHWLRSNHARPEQVFCSSARRTRETWEELKLPGEPELRHDLYHASPDTMMDVLRTAEARCVMMIGHNPGIALLAQTIVAEAPEHARFGDFPTGSLLIADFGIKKWTKLTGHSGSVVTFLTPHDLIETAD
ncbi:histidine phosphatase family protein [Tropicimonas sp. IMCC6043]|uniref:SixA phosphatase family protein n=1 Tax=Tropicimonas sp. IMCC6043 TaxID=2510645 RepID=UPI00101CF627|nr:histidine phosphatase family protein [Tropicimonas sp. IMCC6043]RYH08967.1 histidine phosphatase family protein [Tropicimonas sp. IMCC6043]